MRLSTRGTGRLLWWGGFGCILLVHLIWTILHTAPPPWDMAHHQLRGLDALEAWQKGELIRRFASLSDYYPPLYYLQEAFIFGTFGARFIALLANLPGLVLLGYFTRKIAARCMESPYADAAGLLPLLFPMVAWTSRESLLDLPLSGWVAFSVFLLMRSRCLQLKNWSLFFGLSVAAGMLTKWTFCIFLAPPVVYALATSQERKTALRNLIDASLLALPLILWWYLPNAVSLVERFRSTAEAAAIERDPAVFSLLGLAYYPRALSSYYLYLPLTGLLLWGLWAWFRQRRTPKSEEVQEIRWVVIWLVGGLALMTLLRAKDPRYIMPLAAPLSILLVYLWRRSRLALATMLCIAFLQFLSISFAWTASPVKIALFEYDPPSDYRTLSQEWVFYQSAYFDVAGPPCREDWKLDELAHALPEDARVGFVPELPRFHLQALQLAAALHGRHLTLFRLGASETPPAFLSTLTHIIGKTGAQGIDYLTEHNQDLYETIRERGWKVSQRLPLPDGSEAILWEGPD